MHGHSEDFQVTETSVEWMQMTYDTYGELWLEAALRKSDAELFKELYRLYPLAEVEDYFKGGQWQCELMKMDIQAFFAHRAEAGAPDPPPLEELKLPSLPENRKPPTAPFAGIPSEASPAQTPPKDLRFGWNRFECLIGISTRFGSVGKVFF